MASTTQKKTLTCTLENLSNGMIRVTGRERGRTISYKDGSADSASALVAEVMQASFGAHQLQNGYDMKYIEANQPVIDALKSLGLVLNNL